MERTELLQTFNRVRKATESLCQPLMTEDYVIQSIADVSPPKWHLAHTTWFYEQVVLQQYSKNYKPYNDQYYYLFNSYYQSFGERWGRDIRGTLSRPTVDEVYAYRSAIDERVRTFLTSADEATYAQVSALVELRGFFVPRFTRAWRSFVRRTPLIEPPLGVAHQES